MAQEANRDYTPEPGDTPKLDYERVRYRKVPPKLDIDRVRYK